MMAPTTRSQKGQSQHDEDGGKASGPSTSGELEAVIQSLNEEISYQTKDHSSKKPNTDDDDSWDSEPAPPLKLKSTKKAKKPKKGQAYDASYKPPKESDHSDDTEWSQDWNESPLIQPTWGTRAFETPQAESAQKALTKKQPKGHDSTYKPTSEPPDYKYGDPYPPKKKIKWQHSNHLPSGKDNFYQPKKPQQAFPVTPAAKATGTLAKAAHSPWAVTPQTKTDEPVPEIRAPEIPVKDVDGANMPWTHGHKSLMPTIPGFSTVFQTTSEGEPPATPRPPNGDTPKSVPPGVFKGPPRPFRPPQTKEEEATNGESSDEDWIPWMREGKGNKKRKLPEIPGFADIFRIDEPEASKPPCTAVNPYSYFVKTKPSTSKPKPPLPKPPGKKETVPKPDSKPEVSKSTIKPTHKPEIPKTPAPKPEISEKMPKPQVPKPTIEGTTPTPKTETSPPEEKPPQFPDPVEIEPELMKNRDWPPYPGTIYCRRCFYHDFFRAIKLRRHIIHVLRLLDNGKAFLHFIIAVHLNAAMKSPPLPEAFREGYFHQQIPGDVTALVALDQVIRLLRHHKITQKPSPETQEKIDKSLAEIRSLLNISDAQSWRIKRDWLASRANIKAKLQEAGYSMPHVKLDALHPLRQQVTEALNPLLGFVLSWTSDPNYDEWIKLWQTSIELDISTALNAIEIESSKGTATPSNLAARLKLNCSYCVHSGAENKAKANRPYPRDMTADARTPWAESLHCRYPGKFDENGNVIPEEFEVKGILEVAGQNKKKTITNAQEFLNSLRAEEGAQEVSYGGVTFLVCRNGDSSSLGDPRLVLVKMWSVVEAIESLDFIPVLPAKKQEAE